MLPWIRTQRMKGTNTATKRVLALVAVFLFSFMVGGAVLAQGSGDTFGIQPIAQNTVLGGEDIRIVIAKIIRAAFGLLGIVATCIVIYAGYTIMTAGGNDEKIEEGRKMLINAVIGLAIILSAFAIVQFVITALSRATGSGNLFGNAAIPGVDSFSGTGALGRVVRDHYPFRDQKEVPRNTKISITFAEGMEPASVIEDTNGTDVFGDCKPETENAAIVMNRDCDRLKKDVIEIVRLPAVNAEGGTPSAPIDATVVVPYSGNNEALTFVVRPLEHLGDAVSPARYRVTLTNKIMKPDGRTPAFAGQRSDYYSWEFETSTVIDTTPPTIASVIPGGQLQSGGVADGRIAKNSIVQVTFSEAMDPSLVQGVLAPNSSFSNMIFHRTTVQGEWKLGNAYRTAEFIPKDSCGSNSCGDVMYCLPIECNGAGGAGCSDQFNVLIRTSQLAAAGMFEAVPFTGVADMSGNALDGDRDDVADGKPVAVGDVKTIRANEEKADNYLWKFTVADVIDRSSPYIEKITPSPDKQGVVDTEPVKIWFSRPMMVGPLGALSLSEYMAAGLPPGQDELWFRPDVDYEGGKSVVTIRHRLFGETGKNIYYFTSVPSIVKSVNQNCLYPGRGPAIGSDTCDAEFDENGGVVPGSVRGCVGVSADAAKDTGCIQGNSADQTVQPNVSACLDLLQRVSR